MKKRGVKRGFKILLLAMMVLFIFNSTASTTTAVTPLPEPTPESGGGVVDQTINKITEPFTAVKDTLDVLDKVDETLSFIKKIYKNGLGFIIDTLIGNMVEGLYHAVASWMTHWVFLTPKVINYQWIQNLWSICYIIAVLLIIVGVLLSAFSIKRGKMANTSTGQFSASKYFGTFILSFFLCTFSLLISDCVIWGENTMINAFTRDTLWEQYTKSKSELADPEKSVLLVRNDGEEVTQDNISFSDFSGDKLMRMAYGLELFPEYKQKDEWDQDGLYTGYYNTTFYAFLKASGGARSTIPGLAPQAAPTPGYGLLLMLGSMGIMILIGIFGLLRYVVIGVLAGGSPFWCSYAVFKGNSEPLWGWLNLFGRTVALSIFFDAAWLFCIFIVPDLGQNAQDFNLAGVAQQFVVSLIFAVTLIIISFFWGRWIYKSVKQPLVLAGAEAQEKFGSYLSKFGNFVENTGHRFGLGEVTQAGARMKAKGKTHQDISKEIKDGKFNRWENGSIRDRLSEAKLNADKKLFNQQLNLLKKRGTRYSKVGSSAEKISLLLKNIKTPGFKGTQAYDILNQKGLENVIYLSDAGDIMVDEEYTNRAQQELLNTFNNNHVKEHPDGYMLHNLENDHLAQVKKSLESQNLAYKQAFLITADPGQIGSLQQNAKELEEIINSFNSANIEEGSLGNGLKGYTISATPSRATAMEKFFERNHIRYNKKGSKFTVSETDLIATQNKADNIQATLNSLNMDSHNHSCTLHDEEQFKKAKSTLKDYSIEHTTKENLILSPKTKDTFMQSFVRPNNTGDTYLEAEDERKFVMYEVNHAQDGRNIKQMLKSRLPAACVLESKDKEIVIDQQYADQFEKVVTEYNKLTPYWELSGFYYYKDHRDHDLVVKHSTPPENGRYMGKYLDRKGR